MGAQNLEARSKQPGGFKDKTQEQNKQKDNISSEVFSIELGQNVHQTALAVKVR